MRIIIIARRRQGEDTPRPHTHAVPPCGLAPEQPLDDEGKIFERRLLACAHVLYTRHYVRKVASTHADTLRGGRLLRTRFVHLLWVVGARASPSAARKRDIAALYVRNNGVCVTLYTCFRSWQAEFERGAWCVLWQRGMYQMN